MAALAVMTTLGVTCLVLMLFFSPPKEAREAVARLDPENTPNPSDRVAAIQAILKLALADQKLSGWQQIQRRACKDPDAQVRAVAVRALGDFAAAKPDQVVARGALGDAVFVDTDFLSSMGLSDTSPEVRRAVADFWGKADVLWKAGIKSLEAMSEREKEPQVATSIREALAERVNRSWNRGDLGEAEARRLLERYKPAASSGAAER
jgi:hypothetical protein